MDYTRHKHLNVTSESSAYDVGLRDYMLMVYKYMAFALAITGVVAMLSASSPAFMQMLFGTPLSFIVMLAPLGMAIYLSSRIVNMSIQSARTSLYIYSTLMGLSLSAIFLIYTGESISRVFFITSCTFGAMSIYGYSTKRDLSRFSSFFMMGLFGIIIASLFNIFIKSTALMFVTSVIGVLVFTFFTAFQVQSLKSLYFQISGDEEIKEKSALMGALTLYVQFVNLFVSLLQLLGVRRSGE
ncbi:MAG: Bax inhibitor-1/YccA family protein [Proteobacteria bacterium]|nr:Bax inhibitor-1/YccA family protein [Pseudomonadota bacterium]